MGGREVSGFSVANANGARKRKAQENTPANFDFMMVVVLDF